MKKVMLEFLYDEEVGKTDEYYGQLAFDNLVSMQGINDMEFKVKDVDINN